MASSRMVTTSGLSPRSRVAMGSHQTRLHQLAQLKNLHKTEILVDQDGALPGLALCLLGGGAGVLCLWRGDHHRLHLCRTVLAWQGLCQEWGWWVKAMLQISQYLIEECNIGFQKHKYIKNVKSFHTNIWLFWNKLHSCFSGTVRDAAGEEDPNTVVSTKPVYFQFWVALDWVPGLGFWNFRCSLAKKRNLVAQRIWSLLVAR